MAYSEKFRPKNFVCPLLSKPGKLERTFINGLKKLAEKTTFFAIPRKNYWKPRRTNQCAEGWSEGPSSVGVADPLLGKRQKSSMLIPATSMQRKVNYNI